MPTDHLPPAHLVEPEKDSFARHDEQLVIFKYASVISGAIIAMFYASLFFLPERALAVNVGAAIISFTIGVSLHVGIGRVHHNIMCNPMVIARIDHLDNGQLIAVVPVTEYLNTRTDTPTARCSVRPIDEHGKPAPMTQYEEHLYHDRYYTFDRLNELDKYELPDTDNK